MGNKAAPSNPFTRETAQRAAERSAEVRRQNAAKRTQEAEKLVVLAQLSPRDRLRVELAERIDVLIAVLDKGLRSSDQTTALRAALAWLHEAHGKPTERLEIEARQALPDNIADLEAELRSIEQRQAEGYTPSEDAQRGGGGSALAGQRELEEGS